MTIEQLAVLSAMHWFETIRQPTAPRGAIINKAASLWRIAGDDKSVQRIYGEALDSCYFAGYLARSPDGYFMVRSGRDTLQSHVDRLVGLTSLIGR